MPVFYAAVQVDFLTSTASGAGTACSSLPFGPVLQAIEHPDCNKCQSLQTCRKFPEISSLFHKLLHEHDQKWAISVSSVKARSRRIHIHTGDHGQLCCRPYLFNCG